MDDFKSVKITKVRAGRFLAAVSADERLFVWKEETRPSRLQFTKGISDMVISRLGSAALISRDGQVYTWGANSIGELGHGDRLPRQEPTLVKSIGKVTAISLGNEFCIALG